MASAAAESNPLHFDNALFPPFGKVKAGDVEPGMTMHLEMARTALKDLEANLKEALENNSVTYSMLANEIESFDDTLSRAWGLVTHLKSVADNDELRAAVDKMQPQIIQFGLDMSQSDIIFKGWSYINEKDKDKLTPSQKRIVEKELLSAKLSGIGLEGEKKEKYNANAKRLGDLSTKFTNNLQDATKAFKLTLKTKEEVDGLPPSALALAAQAAKSEGHESATAEDGPWVITLDIPSYLPAMQHAKDRALREKLYRAYLMRASEFSTDLKDSEGKIKDNAPIIYEILKLKKENADLLGYECYAEVSMAKKMATMDTALDLIEKLRSSSYDAGMKELEELKKFAQEKGFEHGDLKQWDVPFYAERLKEEKYAYNAEDLKPYFALPNVTTGLWALAKKLFSVDIDRVSDADLESKGISLWHPDVQVFQINRDGKLVSYFYLDPYSRPETKKGGAWMDEVSGRTTNPLILHKGETVRLPIAHMVCNQSPPVGDEPSLMTFGEVETLFHEFGHSLQHMLTQETEGMAAGIKLVDWDAVEQPSQFMENWCYDKETIDGIAKHYKTNEAIPEDLWKKVVEAKNYRAASQMLRQLHFSYVDLKLHSSYDPNVEGTGKSVWELDKEVSAKFDVLPIQDYDRFLCSFAHIFAGGYAAGYFSYKWAEVLSADCFAAFEEAGLNNEEKVKETGKKFADTVLGLGGGVPPLEVFKRFRGREPSVEALLRHSGLTATAGGA